MAGKHGPSAVVARLPVIRCFFRRERFRETRLSKKDGFVLGGPKGSYLDCEERLHSRWGGCMITMVFKQVHQHPHVC